MADYYLEAAELDAQHWRERIDLSVRYGRDSAHQRACLRVAECRVASERAEVARREALGEDQEEGESDGKA